MQARDAEEVGSDASGSAGVAGHEDGPAADDYCFSLVAATGEPPSRTLRSLDYAICMEKTRKTWNAAVDPSTWAALDMPHAHSLDEFMQKVDFNAIFHRVMRASVHPEPVSIWYYAILFVERRLLASGTDDGAIVALLLRICLFARDDIYVAEGEARSHVQDLLGKAVRAGYVALLGRRDFVGVDEAASPVSDRAVTARAIVAYSQDSAVLPLHRASTGDMIVCVTPPGLSMICPWNGAWAGPGMSSYAAMAIEGHARWLYNAQMQIPPYLKTLYETFLVCRAGDERRSLARVLLARPLYETLPAGTRFDISCIIGAILSSPFSITAEHLNLNDARDGFLFADLLPDEDGDGPSVMQLLPPA